jgi:AsmA family protein
VLTGHGQYKGHPILLDVQAGAAKGEQGRGATFVIDARIEAGQTRIAASGGISDPERLEGLKVQFEVVSPDANELLGELGVEAPALPPLQAAGTIFRKGKMWQLNDAFAQVGESNLAGRLSVDLSRPRPFISADLESERLRAQDLITTQRERRAAGEGPESAADDSASLLIAAGINLDALPKVDADLTFRGGYIEAPDARLDRLQLDLKLRHRVAVIDATGEGRFRERQPITFAVHAGTEDSLENSEARYPLDVSLHAGESQATVKGTVDHPLNYTGLDVDVALQGPDLDKLGELLDLPLPATPPYKLAGKLTHEDQENRWNLVALRGEFGDSDLAGDVSFELAGERPTIVADLKSKTLDFDDLGVLVGAPPGTEAGETASAEQRREAAAEAAGQAPVLPDEPFDLPELRAVDARVSFTGESIQAKKVPLDRMLLKFTLKDGRMRFDPLRFNLAGGNLEGLIGLEGRSGVLNGEFDLSLRNIRLNQLLSRFDVDIAQVEMEKEGVGTFGGQAKLTVKGNSIHDIAASANGKLAVVMGGGQINALIIEAIGLDVGEILAVLVAGEEEKESGMVPVQCFVSRFDVQDGVMNTKALVLETTDSTVTGSGTIDLGKEAVDLRLLAHPKDASVLTASTPVALKGTFRDPKVEVVSEELEEKGLAALALGVVLPVIGAIIPFIETGEAEGVNCAALMQAAKRAGGVPRGNPSANQDDPNAD